MLRNKALYYYQNGFNCSQCILMACADVYNINITNDNLKMCSVINTGFGIGGMCSVLIACIMVFGIMFDEPVAKRLRIKFLSDFQKKHHSLNCSSLKQERKQGLHCEALVADIAELLENIIFEERKK